MKASYWNIGNGESTNIYTNNWPPFQNDFKFWSTRPDHPQLNMVKNLLNESQKSWN